MESRKGTLVRDVETADGFLGQLHSAKKTIARAALTDVDAFVRAQATRLSRRTVADTCSSLRAFLRFLRITGRLKADLANGVMAPRYRIDERPPRTLPWSDVQKILRSISRAEAPGKRDYAIVLLLATYGLGAAEVLGIRLEDIDWQAGELRVRRPKTKVSIQLPLLPAVARALTNTCDGAAAGPISSAYFSAGNMPYEPITSGAIRHRIGTTHGWPDFRQGDRCPCFSALCRVPDYAACWRASRDSWAFKQRRRGIVLGSCLALWESDKPTLHLLKHD